MINFFKDLFRGRFFGHPIHMMLVHFPSALFPAALILDAASLYFSENSLTLFSFYSLSAAVITAWAALTFGAIDLIKIPNEKREFRTALLHGGLNFLWLSAFTVLAGLELKNYPNIDLPSPGKLLLEALLVCGLLYSNFLGGELVLKYDIGKKYTDY